jgi:hypothetical protein
MNHKLHRLLQRHETIKRKKTIMATIVELFESGDYDMESVDTIRCSVEKGKKLLAKHPSANMMMVFDTRKDDTVATFAKKPDGEIEELC